MLLILETGLHLFWREGTYLRMHVCLINCGTSMVGDYLRWALIRINTVIPSLVPSLPPCRFAPFAWLLKIHILFSSLTLYLFATHSISVSRVDSRKDDSSKCGRPCLNMQVPCSL